MSLKDKGFSYAAIDKAMQMANVDGQIAAAQNQMNRQKANVLKQDYLQAISTGNQQRALYDLGEIANLDKTAAAMYSASAPSIKDVWNRDNKRQDAKTNFGYQQQLAKQKHVYGQEDMQTKAQLQTMMNAKTLQDKLAIEQSAKLAWAKKMEQLGVPREQILNALSGMGGTRNNTANTVTNGVKSSDGNVYTVNGQPVKMSSKDIELKNQLENNFKYAWDAVNNPENIALKGGDGGADDVDNFTRLVIDNKDKMSPEAYSHYYSLAAATQFLREKGAGHENMAAELWAQISPEVKEQFLSQY